MARSVTNTEKSTILVVAVTGEHTRMINDDVKKRSTEPVGSNVKNVHLTGAVTEFLYIILCSYGSEHWRTKKIYLSLIPRTNGAILIVQLTENNHCLIYIISSLQSFHRIFHLAQPPGMDSFVTSQLRVEACTKDVALSHGNDITSFLVRTNRRSTDS